MRKRMCVENSLHAFTATLGVETERRTTEPAVNQVQLARRDLETAGTSHESFGATQ
jgi:hypothetical protein